MSSDCGLFRRVLHEVGGCFFHLQTELLVAQKRESEREREEL